MLQNKEVKTSCVPQVVIASQSCLEKQGIVILID